MEKEVTRRQLVEEVQAQFEKKLRDAKRQKSQAEEELESASERWRSERRKLNAEIDRLEASLAEAKAPSKRKASTATGVDPEEVAKLRTAAEERFNAAAGEWETERKRLELQVARVEEALVEALERSGNPIRSVQPIKDHFEMQLQVAERDRTEVEQEFLRAKAQWDEEKKKLTGDLIKLRRMAPSKALEVKEKIERLHGRKDTVEEARIKELEGKLEQANADIQKYHEISIRAKEEAKKVNSRIAQLQEAPASEKRRSDSAPAEDWTKEREELQSQIQRLKQTAEEAKDGARSEFETRVERASRERSQIEDQLAANTQKWEKERRELIGHVTELEKRLTANAKAWETERGELNNQITELERSRAAGRTTDAAAKAANRQREEIEEQLATSSAEWNRERRDFRTQIVELQEALNDAKASDDKRINLEAQLETGATEWDAERRELKSQISELQETLAEARASSDKRAKLEERIAANTEEWEKERLHLDNQIVQLQQALAGPKDTDEGAYQQWASERQELQNDIQKLRLAVREKDDERDNYELRVEQGERARVKLEERLETTTQEWETERHRLDDQIAELHQALTQAKDTDQDAYQEGAKERQELEGEVRRLHEAERERERLEQESSLAAEEWVFERQLLKEEISQLRQKLTDSSKSTASTALEQWTKEREELQDRIQELNQAIVRVKDEVSRQYEPHLQDANREIAKLEEQMTAGARQAEQTRNQLLDQVTQLQQEVALAKNSSGESLEQWATGKKGGEIQKLRLAAARAKEEARLQYEYRLEEAFHERAKLEEQSAARAKQLELERQQLQNDVEELQKALAQAKDRGGETTNEQWASEREDLQNEIRQLQRSLSENRDDDIVDQLRKQFDQKLQDMIEQKTQLSNELLEASTLLQSERERFASEVSQSSGAEAGQAAGNLDTKIIDGEVQRVERVLREIMNLIDDPSTELSMVIRKNVEKAELDAYLKGILFSIGRAKGLQP